MDEDDALWHQLEALKDKEDCNCAGCLFVNTPDDESPMPKSESDDEQEDKEDEPPQLEHTQRKKAVLEGKELLPKVLKVLDTIHAEGLSLSLFLNALSWGDDQCTASDRVHYARTGLLLSEELPGILLCWYKPACNKNKGRRPAGACCMLKMFAVDCLDGILERQMEHLALHFTLLPSELSEIHLTEFNFKALIETIKGEALLVWSVMARFSHSNKQ
ncbi:hypothetical protein PAXINDRAFT_85068 [Paxillus involutus ATCC 200175]|uniref:Uncharacterized protein n=1 Tax=Paxillus involutus ATCC 200175 TaxID=664439 RepID=A0A0C9TK03_PAXIN|nr:hypothetical protein PAXINDRAFT_85068 [Paxillus involutus ATCC 200175]